MEDSNNSILLPAAATAVVAIVSGIYWYSTNRKQSVSSSSSTAENSKPSRTIPSTASMVLKNIWDAPRNMMISHEMKLERPDDDDNHNHKPFGSKYYYAHNNPNSTGGYKDGLKMEDYTMNTPRLLSKNGKQIIEPSSMIETTTMTTESMTMTTKATTTATASSSSSSNPVIIRHITKYLWDDPGDITKGIATIRIDSLPSLTSPTEVVDWNSVLIDKVDAQLPGEGLIVQVYSRSDPSVVQYVLKIPKLYGDAASVQAIVKPKRLLIKLTKKKTKTSSVFSNNTTKNLEAWPQPHRKV